MQISRVGTTSEVSLLAASQSEMELLAGVLRETVRLTEPDEPHMDRNETWLSLSGLCDRLFEEISPWTNPHPPKTDDTEFAVHARTITYSLTLSTNALEQLAGAIRFILSTLTRPQLHTFTGNLPDELWKAHFELTGRYPESKIR